MLNRQRRERPAFNKAVAAGARMVRERFGVDADTCTGDHSCIRLSECPSLTIKPNPDPLRQDPIAHVDNSCVGCGVCGEVAHAAVLCPSFYRARLVFNPTRWDRMLQSLRARVIGFFQRRAERRRLHMPSDVARPLSVAIAALGGQGGGVLADWLVAVAELHGWIVQATSIAGVAQRTGTTVYYLEMIPPPRPPARRPCSR